MGHNSLYRFTLSLLSLALTSAALAQTPPASECGPVLNGAKMVLSLENMGDMVSVVTDKSKDEWHYTFDSTEDGFSIIGAEPGLELHGMAYREFSDEIWVVINGNTPAAGFPMASVQGGTISYGDLFIDLSSNTFAQSSTNKNLFGIHFVTGGESSVTTPGVYKNVYATTVATVNRGHANFGACRDKVIRHRHVFGFGDLDYKTQTYYDPSLNLNVIAGGTFAGPITFVGPSDLAKVGYTSAFAGTYSIAFKFNKSLLIDTCGVIGGDGKSCLDCKGIACGSNKNDLCGVCGGDSSSCKDCKGVPNGASKLDVCGVCDGGVTDIKVCAAQQSCPGGTIDNCGVCNGNNACQDCAGVPNGTSKIDCCGICGGDGSTCLDKCVFYDLTKTKKSALYSINLLYASVKKYSNQEIQCSHGLNKKPKRALKSAEKIYDQVNTNLKALPRGKVKSCNTPFCAKESYKPSISKLQQNINQLYFLSKNAQYGAGDSCKTPKTARQKKKLSFGQFKSASNALGNVPNVACVN